jgi:hypothetical protein
MMAHFLGRKEDQRLIQFPTFISFTFSAYCSMMLGSHCHARTRHGMAADKPQKITEAIRYPGTFKF